MVRHVGLLELPLQMCGRPVLAGGIHAVCTLAERRRKGLYRRVMGEVLACCDERHERLVSDAVGVRPEQTCSSSTRPRAAFPTARRSAVSSRSRPGRRTASCATWLRRSCRQGTSSPGALPRAERVVWCFSPDGLGAATEPDPLPAEVGIFMVRGPFAAEGLPSMLPPTVRH